ncbi:uncharacterized protein A4U43_C08F22610 [Asparagus officinalis]|nr:uncharacterized protein A4U43_C08F22610 [Asparagus officinalis]
MRCCSEGKAKLAGVALCHPYFWGSELIGSETSDPTVRGRVEGLWRVANRQGVGVDDSWFNPMAEDAPSLRGLGCERLMVAWPRRMCWRRGEGVLRGSEGERVERGGGVLVEAEGEDHVFFYMKPECVKALELRETMVAFIKRK